MTLDGREKSDPRTHTKQAGPKHQQAAEKCTEDVSRSSLWFSVRSLCLCGECFCSHFTTETQRTTEIAQRNRYPARADDFFSSLLNSSRKSFRWLAGVPESVTLKRLQRMRLVKMNHGV